MPKTPHVTLPPSNASILATPTERKQIMILGMTAYTFVHVLLSLIGILSGLVVAFGLLGSKKLDGWTALFLATTVLTSVTGFFFPFHGFKPSYAVGAISIIALAIAIFARYSRRLAGSWRRTYVITAMIALYLNCFVLVAQAFMKVPFLNALAPKGSEPPFLISQVVVMAIFVALTIATAKKFYLEAQ
jgi:predicted anti-sigma-YlaC factor YlaD